MTMRVEDIDFGNVLLDKKLFENILIYEVSYKTFIAAKPFRSWFDKVDRIIRIYGGTKYLYSFGPKVYNANHDGINYLTSEKNNAKYTINHNFARFRIDSYNSLPIKKH